MSQAPAQITGSNQPHAVTVTDQMGRAVAVSAAPRRIVSLVPSQTELLIELGVADRLAGITRYCVHPAGVVESINKVGGTKRLDVNAIVALQPDLIIANKEENEEQAVTELARHCPVWISDIANLADALDMIGAVGRLVGKGEQADAMKRDIERSWKGVDARARGSAAYMIWRKPWMAVAGNTFIDDVLTRIGFGNAFAGLSRYPEVSLARLQKAQPDVVMLSSEPFPFAARHIDEVSRALPDARVVLVDGEMFSWYGSRLSLAPAYFQSLLRQLDKAEPPRG